MQITLHNASDGAVDLLWDPVSLPPSTKQIQIRQLSNVSPGNAAIGFDVLATTQSVKSGRVRLSGLPGGVLILIAAAAITDNALGPQGYGYADIEGSNLAAIVPL